MNKSNTIAVTAGVVAFCMTLAVGVGPAAAQFSSDNVSLESHIDLGTFGAGNGNDCWGYVSPSGREYALMGLSNKVAFVEITDPAGADWFASISHTNNLWGDVKVYQHVAYAVTEAGGTGIQVIDMSGIDDHVVTLVRTMSLPDRNHNIVVDADSGFLYTCGSRGGSATTVIFDLSDPEDPVEVGAWSGAYEHDAQVITYTSGAYAGRHIMFGASEGRGLDIIDVTNPSGTFLMSRTSYPNVTYSHQVWTEDPHYLYLNDEIDGIPRTTVFDITDLEDPIMVGEYGSGLNATDHNNYVHHGFVFEADYHSGLRIYNANCDPVAPPQVGWFDTYPDDDGGGYDGAWSCYPFFPSGTVIVSDIDRGLFVLDPSDALDMELLQFDYPDGRPAIIHPAGGTRMRVEVSGACGTIPEPGSGLLHYDVGEGFVSIPMEVISPNVYDAVFPATDCLTEVSYYISAETDGQTVLTDPPDAPGESYVTVSAIGVDVVFADDFEVDQGWNVQNLGATTGDWQRGVPVDDPDWAYDPASDADGSGQCYLTQNEFGNTDVDDGAVRLTSPVFGMSEDGTIAYQYFLRLTEPGDAVDLLLVEINSDGGSGDWIEIARHDTDGGLNWRPHEIDEADLDAAGVELTASMRMRFTANDANPQSIVEAGVDAFSVLRLICCAGADGDMNADGVPDGRDIQPFVDATLGTPTADDICHGDFDGDGDLGPGDISGMVAALLAP